MAKGRSGKAGAALTVHADLFSDTFDVASDDYDSESSEDRDSFQCSDWAADGKSMHKGGNKQKENKQKEDKKKKKKKEKKSDNNKKKGKSARETEESKSNRSSASSTSSGDGAAQGAAAARRRLRRKDKADKGGRPSSLEEPSDGPAGAAFSEGSGKRGLRRPSSFTVLNNRRASLTGPFRRSASFRDSSSSHGSESKALPMRVEGAQRSSLTPKAASRLGLDEDGNVLRNSGGRRRSRRFSLTRTFSDLKLGR